MSEEIHESILEMIAPDAKGIDFSGKTANDGKPWQGKIHFFNSQLFFIYSYVETSFWQEGVR